MIHKDPGKGCAGPWDMFRDTRLTEDEEVEYWNWFLDLSLMSWFPSEFPALVSGLSIHMINPSCLCNLNYRMASYQLGLFLSTSPEGLHKSRRKQIVSKINPVSTGKYWSYSTFASDMFDLIQDGNQSRKVYAKKKYFALIKGKNAWLNVLRAEITMADH